MKVLIVHAHPEPQSFCTALWHVAREEFALMGHAVEVSDLYGSGFNPVASRDDFTARARDDYLVYTLEQRQGFKTRTLAPEIQAEVDKLLAADLLVLNFPIFWFSVPAILKGWIDRVFLSGPFYGGKRIFSRGGLTGKRALVVATLGGREHMFGPGALHGELNGLLSHLLRGTLGYVGYAVLEPLYAHHVPYLAEAERVDVLRRYRTALRSLGERPLLPVPDLDRFDDVFRPVEGSGSQREDAPLARL